MTQQPYLIVQGEHSVVIKVNGEQPFTVEVDRKTFEALLERTADRPLTIEDFKRLAEAASGKAQGGGKMHNGYPSAEDAKIAQDNLQANGRRTLAALKGLVADGNGVTIDARKAEKALQDDAAVDARLGPAMRHRTIDLNSPPKSVTAPHSGPVGGEFPRLAYAKDGRFKRCADTREWDQLQREGWQFQPFEGFDYSSYFSLCHGVWQARTHEAAHQHRYEPEHGLKVTVVKK